MGRISAWFFNFMKGRYGFDAYGRALSTRVIVLWIISIIVGVFINFFRAINIHIAIVLNYTSFILSWLGVAILAYMVFRMLSRNIEKRRAENERFLARKQKKRNKRRSSGGGSSTGGGATSGPSYGQRAQQNGAYNYLTCTFCGQQMRVPAGKGKIAVKCPSCGEKTIINS